MHYKLNNIADIFTGQTFRSKVENNPEGEVWVIQMKDLNKNYTGISSKPNTVNFNDVSQKQLLRKGDILFLSKGNNNVAFTYESGQPAVAVSLFFVIKVKSPEVLPGYLTWYLNSPATQKFLMTMREGASVSSIKKSIFDEMLIELPKVKKQELIANIYKLSIREEELMSQLIEEKKQYIQTALTNQL
jgi:restriction endonuclease S subunit